VALPASPKTKRKKIKPQTASQSTLPAMIKAKAIAGRVGHAAKGATLQIGTMQRARWWLLHLEWQGNPATIAATIATTLALGLALGGRKPLVARLEEDVHAR